MLLKATRGPSYLRLTESQRAGAVVVLGSVAHQVVTQVEQRPAQDTAMAKQEGDEQATHPAVPIEERVDRLELGVCQAAVDQRR